MDSKILITTLTYVLLRQLSIRRLDQRLGWFAHAFDCVDPSHVIGIIMDGDDHRTAIAADTDGLRGWSLRGQSLNLVPTYIYI